MSVTLRKPVITWEKIPESFILDDEPVDNTIQTPIAVALSDALHLAGRLPETALACTNVAVCATIDGKLTTKAPDWFYVPSVLPREQERERRSYTPHIEGDVPAIVMEFLSETKGGEYSKDSEAPVGKWYYYEKILQVPIYAIFSPRKGRLEVHELQSQKYRQQKPDENNRYWIAEMGLFLGVWFGTKQNRTGNWLRWWDENGQMLPWLEEQVMLEQQRVMQEQQRAEQERQRAEQERQRAEQERHRAEQERQRAEQERQQAEQERQQAEQEREAKEVALRELALLKEKLNSAGINPEEI
ncbi:MAG: hypothetical protein F6J93_21330 [Oscillatoria sp. SIO1A7]|nr:hypothetical protein [Oscillatoria sp. SIO1A7]